MDPAKLVQALAVAWGGVHLYPDPKAVPAFTQAVETIGEYAGNSPVITITLDGFEWRGEPVDVSHSAADRLVEALFAERVKSLVVSAAPTADQLIQFFKLLEDPGSSDLGLDFPTRLQLAGVDGIRIQCHDALEDRDDEEEDDPGDGVEREPEVQALFERDSARRVADRVMSHGSPAEAVEDFIRSYRSAYEMVSDGDPAGLARVVETFVDAFFRLDHAVRAAVFQEVVKSPDEVAFTNFVDQFSADELAELAGELDDAALPLLVEYARVVSEMQGRDSGVVDRVMNPAPDDTRQVVAGTVGLRLANFLEGGAGDGVADSLSAEVAALATADRAGWVVLGDLFSIEDRPERQKRLLRIWVAKLGLAIRQHVFADAVRWLRVVEGQAIDSRALDGAFNHVTGADVMEILTADGPDEELRNELLLELSRRSGPRVIEQLATEEDPGRRRMLIDIVTEIARVDIRSILPGLADPRWYVVRNLAIALGKSGRKAAGEPLSKLMQHDDHRVRIEALRALIPCLGDAAVDHLVLALADEHVRVRAAAADLLATVDDQLVVPALGSALRNESTQLEVRVAAIEVLGKRRTDDARTLLRQMAETKGRFSQSARALRSAARDALGADHV
ncbi:MAG: HEAT repeat domain-containing protein [Acidimicrobiia bacterium]|nr:HEAT repeat domain-containing protein [Acidimicrobiia bacterium]NNF09505.1 HEAT repeat domain-containing protein [Acidimicrobiia bacterium]NNL71031.1 HEAT repeat domain-containing protein [Acidimicrobiia bacterium]